ncbi:hypothetical protein BLL37_26440 [Pseudomonas azotoformans]|uniref:Uncharacterized protein n=1 Tax=Pseudomonas azotoformans TaxID=47878 RepID=A0A1V2J8F5_PSEAZ|nr:hypothetical protein BFL39_13370 [Pseudomonas azotoformans]ONH41692.1 hypothetical protein BLL37_26440 [Pseudomonas azotoformans]
MSYRPRLSQDFCAKRQRQIGRRQQVHIDTQQILKFYLQPTQIKESGSRRSIDQQIQIAALLVGTQ